MSYLNVSSVCVDFLTENGSVKAVNDISFEMNKGETFGIIGESGSGKSVIAQAILRLLPSNAVVSGKIFFESEDILSIDNKKMRQIRGREISLIPQNPAGSLNPLLKNKIQVAEVFEVMGVNKKEGIKSVLGMLKNLLMKEPAHILENYPHELSGGMKQRLLAAMCLSYKPSLLIADEPTKGLDSFSKKGTLGLFRHMKREHGNSMLVITHDLDFALEICDRVAVMYAGQIVEVGPVTDILQNPSHPYTKALLNALPRNGLIPLHGHTPSRIDLPDGCLFHERCNLCFDKCGIEAPSTKSIKGGVVRCHLY